MLQDESIDMAPSQRKSNTTTTWTKRSILFLFHLTKIDNMEMLTFDLYLDILQFLRMIVFLKDCNVSNNFNLKISNVYPLYKDI